MAQITIDASYVGQVILSGTGVINSIQMVTPPSVNGYREHLTLSDNITGYERDDFNLDISTSHFGTGSMIHSGGDLAFIDLMLKSIPQGSTFLIDYSPPPTLASLNPDTAVTTDAMFELHCIGTDFTDKTIIVFAGQDEPTRLVSDTDVWTYVKPELFAPDYPFPVQIRVGSFTTDTLYFTFTAPAETQAEEEEE